MAIITISREAFSGGEELARAVADHLGYPCVSRDSNLAAAAAAYGVPAHELQTAMERPPSFWERLVGDRTAYLTVVGATLCRQAQHGNLVYHGHLGHLLLPGITHVIGIRVVADQPTRLAAARASGPIDASALAQIDRKQRQWVRFLFDVDWEDPRLYDLVVNLSNVQLSTACDLVTRMAISPEFQPTADSERAFRDLCVASDVRALLAQHPDTKELSLGVEAADGVVTITGTSASEGIETALASALRQLHGVSEVRWKIAVVPTP